MPKQSKSFDGSIVVHPGAILDKVLKDGLISQKEVADAVGKSTPVINDIIKGRRSISAEIAYLLEAIIPDMSATDWLSLQNQFDLAKIRGDEKVLKRRKSLEEWEQLKQVFNVNYLKKKLNLSGDSTEDNVTNILHYFGDASVQALEERATQTESYFRKSTSAQVDKVNLMTWMLMVRKESSDLSSPSVMFDSKKNGELIQQLNSIFYKNENTIEKTCKVLKRYGIKFIDETDRLDKTPVDGYSFWEGDHPTIAVSLRYKRLDNFAFVVMHELGHITKHIKRNKSLDYIDILALDSDEQKEIEANDFAVQALAGNAPLGDLYEQWRYSPFTAKRFIVLTSETYMIHQSIITGQFQHHIGNYAACRDLIDNIN